MAYRTGTSPRILVVRPDPIHRAISYGVASIFFLWFGLPKLLSGKQVDVEYGPRVIPLILGGAFTLGGGLMIWVACKSLATKIRLTVDEVALELRWTRFGKETKYERVPREQLVDVGVKDTPMSGRDHHCVVIGTCNGDIELGDGHSGALRFFVRRSEEIASFLALPVRPR
jgi:hypothetical protein